MLLLLAILSPREALSQSPDRAQLIQQITGLVAKAQYPKALQLAEQLAARTKRQHGDQSQEYAIAISWIASIYQVQGRFTDAGPHLEHALAIFETALPPDHPDLAVALSNLGLHYQFQGRYAAAERLGRRALGIQERKLQPDHPEIATSLNNIAHVMKADGRGAEAEPLLRRALQIRKAGLDPLDPRIAESLANLAGALELQGKLAEAEGLIRQSRRIRKLGQPAGHPEIAGVTNRLAGNLMLQGKASAAQRLYEEALEMRERSQRVDHPDIAGTLRDLARAHIAQGRYAIAEKLLRKAQGMLVKVLPKGHPRISRVTLHLARAVSAQGRPAEALAIIQDGTKSIIARGKPNGHHFASHVALAWDVYREAEGPRKIKLMDESLTMSQFATNNATAKTLVHVAARFAARTPELQRRVRERDDLIKARSFLETRIIAKLGLPPAKRGPRDAAARRRLKEINDKLPKIDLGLKSDFPEYFELENPTPLAVGDVQALLGPDEALVHFLDMAAEGAAREATFIWVITKQKSRWLRSDLGTQSLNTKVAALRRSLGLVAEGSRAAKSLVASSDNSGFDLDLAHDVYLQLLAPFNDILSGKSQLMVVPSGPLTALPFHLLVTERARSNGADRYRGARWLIRRHALTTLPSVASLASLRRTKRPRRAPRPFVAFANPVYHRGAVSTSAGVETVAMKSRGLSSYFRGASANREAVENLAQLPDTADEARRIAATFGDEAVVYLGKAASETEVKRALLSQYRVVHFATHGLVAGEVKGLAEPALALSVPQNPNKEDDGLLTASEVAGLRLNADWVLLSACNTAAGDRISLSSMANLMPTASFIIPGNRRFICATSMNASGCLRISATGKCAVFARRHLWAWNRPSYAHP